MGFLSSLFGGNKEEKALREALSHIQRILDDEKFQLELVHPAMKAMLESARNLEFEKAAAARDELFRLRELVFGAAQHDPDGDGTK